MPRVHFCNSTWGACPERTAVDRTGRTILLPHKCDNMLFGRDKCQRHVCGYCHKPAR
jgi:hypothetical protein